MASRIVFLKNKMRSATLFLLLMIAAGASCRGQFIRLLKGVPAALEGKLKKDLVLAASEPARVATLLDLGRLYGNRPYPRLESQRLALHYAREARAVAARFRLTREYNQAQLLLGLLFIRTGNLESATAQLAAMDAPTRCDLLEEIAYRYRFLESNGHWEDRHQVARYIFWEQRLADSLKDPVRMLWAEKAVAGMHADANSAGSEKELLEVLQKMRTLAPVNLQYSWFELVFRAMGAGNYDQALYYSQQTLNSLQRSGDSAEAGDILRFHAMVLRRIGRHEESIRYSKLAIQQYERQYGDDNILTTIRWTVDEMVRLKRPAEARSFYFSTLARYPAEDHADSLQRLMITGQVYRLLREYPKAESSLLQAFRLQEEAGELNFFSYRDLGQIYVESKDYAKARPWLHRALALADSARQVAEMSHLYYCLYKADSATGHYKDGLHFLYLNKEYDDIALTRAKTEAIEKYVAQFDLAKKEAALKLRDQEIGLFKKGKELDEARLKRSQELRNILLAGALAILAGGAMFYYQLRKNRRASRIISEKNRELQAMLEEKNWLLREVHHRVKNNLHTVICLLESQAMYLKDDALDAIEKSQNRIYAMSLIHQKLYQDDAVRTVDMSVYLREFVQYLQKGFDAAGIGFGVEVEHVQLELAQAIPLALIINEAVTNSIKYAFPGHRKGMIRLALGVDGETIRLVVADDGIGFDPPAEGVMGSSLGLQLIRGLCGELKGGLSIDGSKGTRIMVEFGRSTLANSWEGNNKYSYAI